MLTVRANHGICHSIVGSRAIDISRDRRSEVPGWEDILERVVVVGGGGRAAAAALGVGAEVVEPVVGAGFLGGAVRAGDGVEPAERVVVVGAGLPAGPATPR